jgi:hypothetical protein
LRISPNHQAAYQELFSTYYNQKRRQELIELLEIWTANNPNDRQAFSILNSIQNSGFDFPDTTAIREALQQ